MMIKLNQILSILMNRQAGTHVSVSWQKNLKVRAGVNHVVSKRVKGVFRAGINYDNKADVQAARESGMLPKENAGLPWGQWVQFPYHIGHKGKDYVRLYPASMNLSMTVEYFIDGNSASAEDCKALCLASEFRNDKEKPLCLTVAADNIIQIGAVAVW